MRSRAGMWAAVLAVAGALGTGGVAHAADTIVVNQPGDDAGSCPGTCTLRAAVASAQDGDTIELGRDTYTLTAQAPIVVSHAISITGDGVDATTIDGSGNGSHRIFTVYGHLQLSGVTLQKADSGADDTCSSACETLSLNGGGAILNAGTLDLDHVRFTLDNSSLGGGVSSSGTLTMSDVELDHDDAAFGGGLFVRGGTATVQRASFHDLDADTIGSGGAIFVYTSRASLALSDSTVAGSGWGSGLGGGIENSGGSVTLTRDTLARNWRGAILTESGGRTEVGETIIGAGGDDGGDWACVPSGLYGDTTQPAITQDDGNNLDEDGHCGLTLPSDRSGDAHLAPLAANGGPTPTFALLHDSPALGAIAACSGTDQRGVARPQGDRCDIGAFEAVENGPPSATTGQASDIAARSATLNATVELQYEAGGAHFVWGTDPQHLDQTTGVGAAGLGTTASVPIDGLEPGTTYAFRAIADNASGASSPGDLQTFTTDTAPPAISDVQVDSTTDTSATISFLLDSDGEATTYAVRYGTDDLTYSTDAAQADATPGARRVTVTIDQHLDPDSTYEFEAVASNARGESPDEFSSSFTTERQLTAHPGGHVSLVDDEDFGRCPGQVTIDWGDGSAPTTQTPDCEDMGEDGAPFEVRADHQYTTSGHYPIVIDYGAANQTGRMWALISGDEQHVLTVVASGPGGVFGDGVEGCRNQTCRYDYDPGTQVSLSASQNDNADFLGWSGACAGTGDCQVTLDADRTVTARFAGPPVLSDGVGIDPVDDTSAQLHFSVDPNGADTQYSIQYGTTDAYGQSTAGVDLGATPGNQFLTPTLAGLAPDTTYYFEIVATSTESQAPVTESGTFTTEPQVAAPAGQTVTIHDSFPVDGSCPSATIDWGDGSAADAGIPARCSGNDGTLTASHTYAAAGHYPIEIAYDDGGGSEQWALISALHTATPTPTPTATATASPTPTPTVTPPPTPVFHQAVVVRPISGTVLVRRKGSKTFVPLDTKAGVPLGSQVDVTHGRIALTSVPKRGGKPETAQFYSGIFTVTQSGSVTVLTLSGPKPTCAARGAASAAAKKKKVKSRQLWGDGHGSFRTAGQYSAATVRGTQWLVEDTCAGTLTRVAHGLVAVTDRVRHKTVLVRGGKRYLARPPKHH